MNNKKTTPLKLATTQGLRPVSNHNWVQRTKCTRRHWFNKKKGKKRQQRHQSKNDTPTWRSLVKIHHFIFYKCVYLPLYVIRIEFSRLLLHHLYCGNSSYTCQIFSHFTRGHKFLKFRHNSDCNLNVLKHARENKQKLS